MPAVNLKLLHEYLDAFSGSAGVPVTLYTPDGVTQEELLPEQKFCKFFWTHRRPDECSKNLLFSTRLSYDMGEPYIYFCPIGLIHIAVPVIVDEKYCACAVAGPLAMGPVSDEQLECTLDLNPNAGAQLTKIALFISKMQVYNPNQIQQFSLLLYSAVLQSHKNWRDYEQLSARHKRQLMVGEHIQKHKQGRRTSSSPPLTCAELESTLAQKLQARDRDAALSCLDSLFEQLILVEGGNFDSIKLHVFELYIFLARLATESGAALRNIFGTHIDLIASPNELQTIEELAKWTRDVVLHFTDDVFAPLPQVSDLTSRAVAYIGAHYTKKLTLRELAASLFVSDSHLSKLFRQELGIGFTEYLNKIRIERAMELIRSTNQSLLEITNMVGFDDQSYFTKVFKRATGMTPRQYKGSLAEEKRGMV